MRAPILTLLLSFAALAASPAHAELLTFTGADSSGGGKVVACRNSDGSLKSVELLDLFEARALYGLTPAPEESSVDAYLATVEKKLAAIYQDASFMMSPYELVKGARARMRLLPSGTELVNLDDAEEIALPVGCKTEQLAVFRQNALLLINSDLWAALDIRNQAALFVHEGIYQWDRETEATNSIYARKVTGHLFSDFEFEPLLLGVPEGAMRCALDPNKDGTRVRGLYNFYLYETPGQPRSATLQFTFVDGKIPFSKTFAWAGNIPPEGGASQFVILQSVFETLPGMSLAWNSKDDLLAGKFEVFFRDTGTQTVQCYKPKKP